MWIFFAAAHQMKFSDVRKLYFRKNKEYVEIADLVAARVK
jgi:hypothetical protein